MVNDVTFRLDPKTKERILYVNGIPTRYRGRTDLETEVSKYGHLKSMRSVQQIIGCPYATLYSAIVKKHVDIVRIDPYILVDTSTEKTMQWILSYEIRKASKEPRTRREVYQIHPTNGTVIKRHYSVAAAARKLKTSPGNIVAVAKGRNKTAAGFAWKYVSA